MSSFETYTTVSSHGEIHLAGVPFQPGTEVEVVVSPKDGARRHPRLTALPHYSLRWTNRTIPILLAP